ncbi:hypothetical protein [Nesterenkonia marinintestina]|uniref:hypothetical protein n=1 Tax=Nesterenkonia marinintestina TaxID=2979865 RepID=UPI0021BFD5B4|nr:hypothetical protein [Nesterenkonia sp. GX14115]
MTPAMEQPVLPFMLAAITLIIVGVLRLILALTHMWARTYLTSLRRTPAGPIWSRALSGIQWASGQVPCSGVADPAACGGVCDCGAQTYNPKDINEEKKNPSPRQR